MLVLKKDINDKETNVQNIKFAKINLNVFALIYVLISLLMIVEPLSPLKIIKYEIAVMAMPLKTALIHLGFSSKLKLRMSLDIY